MFRKSDPSSPDAIPLPPVAGLPGWYADESKPVALAKLLASPIMQEAMAILLERSRFSQSVTSSDPASHSAKLGWMAGYAEAISDLRSVLTDPEAPRKFKEMAERRRQAMMETDFDMDEPWAHINQGAGIFSDPLPEE